MSAAEQLDMGLAHPAPRFPTRPLLDKAGAKTAGEFALRWGVPIKPLCNSYGLNQDDADEYALAAGFMPHEVWLDWYERTCPNDYTPTEET